jgi:abequosyltransferase
MPKLSICIPTCNRAAYLTQLLDSIFSQRATGIEIIVRDNNSNDNTKHIVKSYQSKHKNLIYIKNARNLGFDANVLAAVSAAASPYCWLIGDDDVLKKGAIEYVLENIKTGRHDFYALSADLCDSKLKYLQHASYLRNARDGEVFNLSDNRQTLDYLGRVKANMGLFGYMGATVFRKDLWDKVEGRGKVSGLGWIHVYTLWYFRNFGASFKFLARPVIGIRTRNDEVIKNNGKVARLIIEFKGLEIIAKTVFGKDKDLYNAFLSSVAGYVAPNSLPPLFALKGSDKKNWPELVKYIKKYPYSEKFKKSLNSKYRISFIYFLREFLNKPACRYIKKPFKFVKDLIFG